MNKKLLSSVLLLSFLSTSCTFREAVEKAVPLLPVLLGKDSSLTVSASDGKNVVEVVNVKVGKKEKKEVKQETKPASSSLLPTSKILSTPLSLLPTQDTFLSPGPEIPEN